MQKREQLLDVLGILYKWRKFILGLTLLTAIGSVLISLFMDDYYESTTLFYAAHNDLAKELPIGEEDRKTYYYGSREDIDRLMGIAESDLLADFLIDSFNLYKNYHIDPNDKKARLKVLEVFKSQYKVTTTKYDAMELSIEDTDPEMAVKMTNAAREKINTLAKKAVRQGQAHRLKMAQAAIDNRTKVMKAVDDSLQVLADKYGLLNFEMEGDILPTQYALKLAELNSAKSRLKSLRNSQSASQSTLSNLKAQIGGLESGVSVLKNMMENFSSGKAAAAGLIKIQEVQNQELAYLNSRYSQLESAYHTEYSAIQIIQDASYPRGKSRPKRSIIVVLSVFLGFILSCTIALIAETYRSINWKEVFGE